MEGKIVISTDLERDLNAALSNIRCDKLFVLTDENTLKQCWTKLQSMACTNSAQVITIGSSDVNKSLNSLATVWMALSNGGATRKSCIINLGGGMITDLGGFAASTFKRGIRFINIPTTLLAMVDASVGGKTGINFNGLKNEVGTFCDAQRVLICTDFLNTLDTENLRSGYAEMLKHALISNDKMWAEHINFSLEQPNLQLLQRMVADSVAVKERIVTADPHEHGMRKALNLGHTVGHAFEALALEKHQPVLHGYAVAYGLICSLYLSAIKTGFPTDKLRQTLQFIKTYYGAFPLTCDDYPALLKLMHHDKKNTSADINFTLLSDVGDVKINQTATEDEIKEAFDFYREC